MQDQPVICHYDFVVPVSDLLSYPFLRFGTHCRAEVHEGLSPTIRRYPGSECITQKINACFRVIFPSVRILTVEYLSLLKMEFQPALREPLA